MYFTYLLGWAKENKYYYGVRYKDNINESSLGTSYWSSSKYVKNFIDKYGYPDIIEIRKKFNDKQKAKCWEDKVLRRVRKINHIIWLNKSNNNSFNGVIMDEEMKHIISNSRKGKSQGILYNNKTQQKYFKINEEIPPGWVKGRIVSEKQRMHIENLNIFNKTKSEEKRKEHYKNLSNSTKGKPKPEGFGEKISNKMTGKPKPWLLNENNCSKRDDVRLKISQRKKGIKLEGKWYTNNISNVYIKPNEIVPNGFILGKCLSEKEKIRRKEYYKNKPKKHWYNNGIISKMYVENNQPNGWNLGRFF